MNERKQQQQPQQHQDKSMAGNKPGKSDDRLIGQDTDNDGRVVQPGHKPGEIDGDRRRK